MEGSPDTALAAARRRYVETSGGTVRAIVALGEQLATAPDSHDLLSALRRELHRVAGTAAGAGFGEAGRAASAMEGVVRHWAEAPGLDRNQRSMIVRSFGRLLGAFLAVTETDPEPGKRPQRILLIELPDELANPLVAEATLRGFAVERVAAAEFGELVAASPPWGVVTLASETLDPDEIDEVAGVARVMLRRDARMAPVPTSAGTRVLDAASDASEIVDLLLDISAQRGTAGATVVIVDDDPVVLMLLSMMAKRLGMVVETAQDGAGFLARMERVDPALVVIDIELPDTDGITLLRGLRAGGRHRAVPVLILSGRGDEFARTEAFDAGTDDYMLKPVVPSEFSRRIAKLLEQRRQRRMSTGLHAITGLTEPARTMQDLDALLGRPDRARWTVGVVQGEGSADGAAGAAWERECTRIAHAVEGEGGTAGLLEQRRLAVVLPVEPLDAVALLTALVGDAPAGAPTWNAGFIGAGAGGITPRALLDTAADAARVARETGVPARAWNATDADIAPDVILVENDGAFAELVAYALDARGLSHRTYRTGPEAMAALLDIRSGDRVPVVLLDVDLPGLDGHSLHERLRLERPGQFKVAFISAHSAESSQLRALRGGALDYLVKPVSLRVLMAKVAVWRGGGRAG